MSAEVLRKASALMRERAETATPGPWSCDESSGVNDLHFGRVSMAVLRPLGTYGPKVEDVRHIASWHPAVALAVADWLDAEAAAMDAMAVFSHAADTIAGEVSIRGAALTVRKGKNGAVSLRADTSAPALVVARAYLGDAE